MSRRPLSEKYRLVLARENGDRVMLLSGLSKVTAEEFQTRMHDLTALRTVLVEPDPDGTGDSEADIDRSPAKPGMSLGFAVVSAARAIAGGSRNLAGWLVSRKRPD